MYFRGLKQFGRCGVKPDHKAEQLAWSSPLIVVTGDLYRPWVHDAVLQMLVELSSSVIIALGRPEATRSLLCGRSLSTAITAMMTRGVLADDVEKVTGVPPPH
nr:hypothetical protein CFP56_30803 [Quercus suber]